MQLSAPVAKILDAFRKADDLARRDEARAAALTVNAYQRLQRTYGREQARTIWREANTLYTRQQPR